MTEVTERVRETFRTMGDNVDVPAFDEVAFRAKVRRARRRRTGTGMLGAGVAAALVTVALVTVPPLLEEEHRVEPGVAGASPDVSPAALPAPVYYLAGSQLLAVTPDGVVHELGAFQSIVGSTAEGVLAVDTSSEPVWIAASSSGEGDGSFTFERDGGGVVRLPDTGPVQSVALSADGRWLAWVDSEDLITIYDLEAQMAVNTVNAGSDVYVTSVSEDGALVSVDGYLALYGRNVVDVPAGEESGRWIADTAGDLVSVVDPDATTRIYDVSSGGADEVAAVPGTGRLSAYGKALVSVDQESDEVLLWTADGVGPLGGVRGTPLSAGWLDEDHAIVSSVEGGGTGVYLCPVVDLTCTRVAFSGDEVRLGE